MAKKTQPISKNIASDKAVHFDRLDPRNESGAGRLTNNMNATPTKSDDKMANAVHTAQDGSKQLNAEDEATIAPKNIDIEAAHESLGWEKKRKT